MSSKTVTAMLALAVLAACAREVPARFDVGFVQSRAGGVADVLAATMPSGSVELTLTAEGQRSAVVVQSGESISLQAGDYQVTGLYEPAVNISTGIAFSGEPRYDVNDVVAVRGGVSRYVVGAQWKCWALVMDGRVCNGYLCNGIPMGMEGPIDGYYVVYVLDDEDWTLTVLPVDESVFEATDVEVKAADMQAGAWYEYRAGRLWQGSGLAIEFPEWVKGE